MFQIEGNSALITGASRGIGESAAYSLAKYGVSVVLAARSTKEIERIAADIREKGGQAATIA
ncbi:3-oxoacyl-[acyl-carrier-protein] reductase, ic [Roseibium sp. TrichSKD4]|nr:3-oxoacyl-[acyl-carrier-protein] reductase, ic [Roseibium sp. TrichSKD4]